jgi:TolA-binding protein
MRKIVFFAAGAAACVAGLRAQEGTEVRRAIPVQRGAEPTPADTPTEVRKAQPVNAADYQNPAWMDRLPVRKATTPEPATRTPEETQVSATPAPVPVATPRAMPTPRTPAPPVPGRLELDPTEKSTPAPKPAAQASATPAASPEPGGEPTMPPVEEVPSMNRSLLAANGFYRRKMFDMAVYEYEKYLIAEPQGKDRDGALFRLGESHRNLGNEPAARDAYQRLLAEFREGEFVGSGAYRLGEIYYNGKNFSAALDMYRKAEANAKEPEVKLAATFFEANTLDKMGRRPQAAAIYAQVAKAGGENPYRDMAAFYIAEENARVGKKQEAFDAYGQLAKGAADAGMQAEATVKAAALAAELGKDGEAKKLFEKAITMPAIGNWRGVAQLGLLRLAYDAGKYKEVLDIAEKSQFPPDSVPESLLIMANARRQLGEPQKALELYDQITRDYSQSDAAQQARFQRLVCLEATGAGDLGKQLDDFLATSNDQGERAQAMLLKAEMLFKKGDYAGAAPIYAKVPLTLLPERLRAQARYKLGWCQLQLQQYTDAAQTFTLFIDQNPKSDMLPAALLQRALAMQQAKAYDGAMRDYDRVIKSFPKAKEREAALQQKALVLGQQEKYDEMAKAFAQLLAEYPKSKSAAQAEYWIGWSAFEKKDYAGAIEHLKKARELDEKAMGERATLRLVLAYYYLENREAVASEAEKTKLEALPAEVLTWLGSKYYADGDYKKAEQFLAPAAARATNPDVLIDLAKARIAQQKYEAASAPIQQYLSLARDPLTRAKGLLASAEVSLGTGNYADADKLVSEAQLLQPEGHYNGEARLLGGEVLMQRGDYDGAARAFATIALLYEDPEVTPKALKRAAEAYKKAGKTMDAKNALAELERRYPKKTDASPSPSPAETPKTAP